MIEALDRGPWEAIKLGLAYCFMTSFLVWMGAILGTSLVLRSSATGHIFNDRAAPYANWDGQWYADIARNGYSYRTDDSSNVAFFPVYPLAGRLLARATGLGIEPALLAVSNASLVGLFCLMARYVAVRYPEGPDELAGWVLLALGLLPTTFFFRMAYSESTFLLVAILVLFGMRREWPLAAIAGLVGLATATRPTGLALVPPLALHVWQRSPTPRSFAARMLWITPWACSGLVAYMAYLQVAFGEPLAFAKAQASWQLRPPAPPAARAWALITLEPLWALYDPSSRLRWWPAGRASPSILGLRAADPVYFLGSIALVIVGAARRWLDGREILMAAGLLLIPYVATGYEQYVQSAGRYAAAAVPVYLVLGNLLARASAPAAAALAGISAFLLGTYTALFCAWYAFI
jgi:hypothetical protein